MLFGVHLLRRKRSPSTGEPLSFEEIYDRYYGVLLDHCERILGDRGEAEDALQEVLLRIYRALPSYKVEAGYSTWLFRIATNVCLNYLRTRRRKGLHLMENTDLAASSDQDVLKVVTARRILVELSSKLDEQEQQLLVDHFITDIDQGQLAQSYGITRRAVAKRLRKIRDRIGHLWPGDS